MAEKGKQYHIALSAGEIPPYVLLPGDPGRVALIAKLWDKAEHVVTNREYCTWRGSVGGMPIACVSTGIGGPAAAIAIEELHKIGCHTFIRVGTCGSLQPGVDVGDLVVTTATVREDGTSVQYVPLSYPAVADLDVTLALRAAAARCGYRAHTGIGQTKDAFYTEGAEDLPMAEAQKERWRCWRRANVLSTSMEAAALFVIGSIRKVRVGEVLAVIGLTYKDEPITKKVGVEAAARCGIEAMKALYAQAHGAPAAAAKKRTRK
ncbi:MAG TPA: nucleoside phosphorylase [Polyangia bacterium]